MFQIEKKFNPSNRKLFVVSKTVSKNIIKSYTKFEQCNVLKQVNVNRQVNQHNISQPITKIMKKIIQQPISNVIGDQQKIELSSCSESSLINKKSDIKIQIFPRGLYNLGNSCYMYIIYHNSRNATLQCLFHLPQFINTFHHQFTTQLSKKQFLPLSTQLHHLLIDMSKNQSNKPLNPSHLKTEITTKKPQYRGTTQQDSQQYLTNLFQLLNTQLTRINQKYTYKQLQNNPQNQSIPNLSQQWWNYYLSIDNSLICDLFQGQIISTIKCKKCGKISVSFDNTWGLPVTFSKNTSVSQLLINTFSAETQVQDYYCTSCKNHRTCLKLLQFFKLPKYLVIQLKRFQYEKNQKKKIKEQIRINQEIQLGNLLNQFADRKQKCRYQLRGIVHHQGQAQYGHYYAEVYCHIQKQWYNINDSIVMEINHLNQISKTAYLLFYQQQL